MERFMSMSKSLSAILLAVSMFAVPVIVASTVAPASAQTTPTGSPSTPAKPAEKAAKDVKKVEKKDEKKK